jgi:predicted transcriptional regulator of viral defense system
MNTYEFNRFLQLNNIRIFRLNDVVKIINKPKHYATIFLSRNKELKRAENGLYYTKEATEYEVASKIVNPSYISLISALRFHNLTEQMPNVIYILSNKRHRPVNNLNGFKVEFRTIKKSLMFGYQKFDDTFVATPEKAVIDMIYLRSFIEYAEEVMESGKLNRSRLNQYSRMSREKIVSDWLHKFS